MLDEAAWLSENYIRDMLTHLCYEMKVQQTKGGQRKLRLYACACCRLIWGLLPSEACQQAVETAERYAEGKATKQDLEAAYSSIVPFLSSMVGQALARTTSPEAKRSAWTGVDASSAFHGKWVADDGPFCLVLRDIFGNPFRPAAMKRHWLTANDRAIVNLARAIYDEKAFDRMPILADALEDAGCDSADILDHCRGPGPHVRGCWVVDQLLGK
jgi:hypothetical protein